MVESSGNDFSSLGDRLECNIPIVARPGDEDLWHASMEVPREILGLASEAQLSVIETVAATLEELRRLNSQTDRPNGISRQPWLVLNCGLWIRKSAKGRARVSVTFSWPSIWADFSASAREAVLRSLSDMLEEARQVINARGEPPA